MNISIVIPVYNGEKYLSQCLDSLLEQDYQDFEIIVVNDASKDNSKKVIQEYMARDARIKFIDKEENGGVSKARNAGIRLAQGKYICFIDCDDWVEKDYLSTLLSMFVDDVCLASCGHKYEYRNHRYINDKKFKVTKFDNKMGLCNIFSDKSCFVLCANKLFLLDLVKQIQFDESQRTGEDFLFLYNYLALCDGKSVVHTTKRLYHYIKTKGSLSSMSCSLDKYYNNVCIFDKLKGLKLEEIGEYNDLLNSRIDSWTFLVLLQFIYYAHSLKLKDEVKKLKRLAKSLHPEYKKQQKFYSSFRRCGSLLFGLILLFLH